MGVSAVASLASSFVAGKVVHEVGGLIGDVTGIKEFQQVGDIAGSIYRATGGDFSGLTNFGDAINSVSDLTSSVQSIGDLAGGSADFLGGLNIANQLQNFGDVANTIGDPTVGFNFGAAALQAPVPVGAVAGPGLEANFLGGLDLPGQVPAAVGDTADFLGGLNLNAANTLATLPTAPSGGLLNTVTGAVKSGVTALGGVGNVIPAVGGIVKGVTGLATANGLANPTLAKVDPITGVPVVANTSATVAPATATNIAITGPSAITGLTAPTALGALPTQSNLNKAYDINDPTTKSLMAAADPFTAIRSRYEGMLNQLQSNPQFETSKLPGYQAGLEAVQRSMGAQGYGSSGNLAAGLLKYGGDAYAQAFDRYAGLATVNPGNAVAAANVGQQQIQTRQSGMLAQDALAQQGVLAQQGMTLQDRQVYNNQLLQGQISNNQLSQSAQAEANRLALAQAQENARRADANAQFNASLLQNNGQFNSSLDLSTKQTNAQIAQGVAVQNSGLLQTGQTNAASLTGNALNAIANGIGRVLG